MSPGPAASLECARWEMVRTPAFSGLRAGLLGRSAGSMAISTALRSDGVGRLETGAATLLVGVFAVSDGCRPLVALLAGRFALLNTAMLSFVLISVASGPLAAGDTTAVIPANRHDRLPKRNERFFGCSSVL